MKNQTVKLTAFYFTIIVSMQAEAVQDVYEYQNSEGVTEFTDEVKVNQKPEKQFQIKKMTAEEEAQSQLKLEQIMEKDKALDKRLARERQLENERKRQYQEQQAAKREVRDSEEDNDYYDRDYYRRHGHFPGRPIRPKPGIKPGTLPVRR